MRDLEAYRRRAHADWASEVGVKDLEAYRCPRAGWESEVAVRDLEE
jgi:hypothetical protein